MYNAFVCLQCAIFAYTHMCAALACGAQYAVRTI